MSDDHTGSTHAAKLAAYVKALADASPEGSVRAFCLSRGLDNQAVTRWANAKYTDVDVESMRKLADGLGLTLGQVLVVAGYGTPEDFGGAVPPPPPPTPSIDVAIEQDPTLSPSDRDVFRGMRAGLLVVARGESGKRRVDTPRRAARQR